jgi:hypothetical protein
MPNLKRLLALFILKTQPILVPIWIEEIGGGDGLDAMLSM